MTKYNERLDEVLAKHGAEPGEMTHSLKQAIKQLTNAEKAKVLDRAKQRFHEPIEHDGSYISISVIDKTFDELIEAERAKLKESSNDKDN